MPILDIFNDDAFTTVSMSEGIDLSDHKPDAIGSAGIFVDNNVRTQTVAVEKRAGGLKVIQTSQRGQPAVHKADDKRTIRDFRTSRLMESARIMASELAFIRDFNEEQAVKELQKEISRRLYGPTGLIADLETTWEKHRLGGMQGIVLDADDSVIYNYFTEFGLSQPAEIAFDLANTANGDLRKMINAQVIRPMRRAAKGLRYNGIIGWCGDTFWDELVANAEVRATYLNQQQAAELRGAADMEHFDFGGIRWKNYVGTDDNTTVAIAATECKFTPAGASGAFEQVWSPGESFEDIGKEGLPIYVKTIPDRDRDSYVDLEVYSYPLMLNKRPELAFRGKSGA